MEGDYYGCENLSAVFRNADACSSESVLTDDDFDYGGTTYTIRGINWQASNDTLWLYFVSARGPALRSTFSTATLNIDGHPLAISSAQGSGGLVLDLRSGDRLG